MAHVVSCEAGQRVSCEAGQRTSVPQGQRKAAEGEDLGGLGPYVSVRRVPRSGGFRGVLGAERQGANENGQGKPDINVYISCPDWLLLAAFAIEAACQVHRTPC